PVTGTVNTEAADPLFVGPTTSPEGSYNAATAVVVVDATLFARDLAGPLERAALAGQSSVGSQATLPPLDRQRHVLIDRSPLHGPSRVARAPPGGAVGARGAAPGGAPPGPGPAAGPRPGPPPFRDAGGGAGRGRALFLLPGAAGLPAGALPAPLGGGVGGGAP